MLIKLTKKQNKAITKVIKAMNALYRGDLASAFKEIFGKINYNSAYKLKQFLIDNKFVFENKQKFNESILLIQDDEKTVDELCEGIDLVIRIAIGQWNELNKINKNKEVKFLNIEIEAEIFKMRDKITPIFKNKKIYGLNASFGITSPEVSEFILIAYDIFKVLMFENGGKGCYGYDPVMFSNEPKPKVSFPYVSEYRNVSKRTIEILKYLAKFYYIEGDNVYLAISDNTSHQVNVGDNVFLKRSGYFDIINKKKNKKKKK